MRLIGLVILTLSLTLAPLAAHALQAGKVYSIGIIDNEASLQAPRLDAFLKELRNLGWIEGSNLIIEARIGSEAEYPSFAHDLAARDLDLIFAAKGSAALVTRSVVKTTPIVIAVAVDPVGTGLVTNLARPGGNITGTTSMIEDLAAKQPELLRTAVPRIRRVAVLFNNSQIGSVKFARDVELAAKTLSVQAYSINWDQADRLISAFGEVKKVRADSLILGPNTLTIRHGGTPPPLFLAKGPQCTLQLLHA